MFLPLHNVTLDEISSNILSEKDIKLSVLRLDKIDEVVSGNKLFKLQYFIAQCLQSTHKTIVTFGGAFSNHLVATASLCKAYNIKCIGIVRGEEPAIWSPTLNHCKRLGMELQFISRNTYKNVTKDDHIKSLINNFENCTIIPEGGFAAEGARGASLIMDLITNNNPTHICTCVGTATTLAGLLQNNVTNAEIIAVPAIKNMIDIEERILELTKKKYNFTIFNEYHFGGYAKFNDSLINFMNTFYLENQIPTDFVYTAKMFYGILDKIETGFFKKGSNIICLHTGGLQGNQSLATGVLNF